MSKNRFITGLLISLHFSQLVVLRWEKYKVLHPCGKKTRKMKGQQKIGYALFVLILLRVGIVQVITRQERKKGHPPEGCPFVI